VKSNFPDLENDIGAQVFYDHYRCKAVHEFAVAHPYAIGRGAITDSYLVPDPSGIRTILNVDRFVHEVIEHLKPAPPVTYGTMHIPTATYPTSGKV
jgi:hypothetical protein